MLTSIQAMHGVHEAPGKVSRALPPADSARTPRDVCTAEEEKPLPPATMPSPPTTRDDNKENIAPVRNVDAATLAAEQALLSHDSIAMRTRRRMAARQDEPPTPPPSAPATPKKRRTSAAPCITPTKRAKDLTPPTTPQHMNMFAQARSLLRTEVLVGRRDERARLHAFLDESLDASLATSACLHISGMPGTGKTALVRDVLRERSDTHMYINCVGLAHPQEAAHRIAAALNVPDVAAIKPRRTLVRLTVVLDELDLWLYSHTHQDILCQMFCLPKQLRTQSKGSVCMALIGIANSLDLTEKFVPVLKGQGVSPHVLHFSPMQAEEVHELLEMRLRDVPGVFARASLQLLARKLTATSGDIRRALDACRQALDLVESEQRGKDAQACVTPTCILRILSHMAGHAQVARVRALGVHAKLLLLAWTILQQRAEAGLFKTGGTARGDGGVCLSDLEAEYARMLENDAAFVTPLSGSELLDVLERLEVQGLVRIWLDVGGGNGHAAMPKHTPATPSKRVSPSAKRAAARQQLATNRRMAPTMERACLVKALTTGAAAGPESTHTPTVVDAMSRLLERADRDIARQTKWRTEGCERERTRREELGGGRGAHM